MKSIDDYHRLKTVVYSAENIDEETDTDYPSESDGDVQADLSHFTKPRGGIKRYTAYIKF
jgi:hypothetical protein